MFWSGDRLVLGGGTGGNTHNRSGCAATTRNTAHNQEWLCHNVPELGAVLVVLGRGYFEFGGGTFAFRPATLLWLRRSIGLSFRVSRNPPSTDAEFVTCRHDCLGHDGRGSEGRGRGTSITACVPGAVGTVLPKGDAAGGGLDLYAGFAVA
jgi:hypothetical protein